MSKSCDDKVLEIFNEISGDRSNRLSASHYPAEINDLITAALWEEYKDMRSGDVDDDDIVKLDGVGFNLVDWNSDAAFMVALILYPEKFTHEDIQEGVGSLLLHVPNHVNEAKEIHQSF